ncbi:secreted protein [Candidatus Thiomargarita nelsonii]|uniref:Secreted protein n=1 Tax=Candidatus Thiomargarita nelsonii TaxID=1003181 RepID=A0A176S5N0_9GAMM|nr:secreted protein [Candidatus Thiomargarita nelsonii]
MNKQSVVAALLCCLITSTTVAQEAVIQMPQQAWNNKQEAAFQGWDDDDWCGTKPRPPFPRGIYDHGSYIPWNSNLFRSRFNAREGENERKYYAAA